MKEQKIKILSWSCFLFMNMMALHSAHGQNVPPPPPGFEDLDDGPVIRSSKSDKKLKIEFDDELVKGGTNKPNAEFVMIRGQFNYKKLIKLREDFVKEVEKNKDDYQNQGK